MSTETVEPEIVSPRDHNHHSHQGKLCPKSICSFVHVCSDCIASQINEANLLPKNSTFLCSTLLSPSVSSSKQALELYIKGMNRDCDRSQRNLCLSSAVEIAPNFREALFWSGILDFRDVKLNISKLSQALSLTEPNTCKALVIQSQILVIQRNLKKAIQVLNLAYTKAENNGERGEVAYFRAFSNWWIDQHEGSLEAIKDFNLAIEYHYNIKSCYTQMAEIYFHLGKPRVEIEDLFQKSLLPTPRHTELLKYGVYLKRIQDPDRAVLMLNAAKERNPDSPDVYEELAFGLQREENTRIALQLDSECRLVHSRRTMAAIFADSNTLDEALKLLTEGINVRQKYEWYCLRGQMYIALNSLDSFKLGIKDLRKAVQLNPLYIDSQYWLGKCLEKDPLGANEVIQRFSNVLYLSPNYSRIPVSVREHISSLDLSFKFYEGEAEGLFNHFLYGSNHINLTVIHKCLTLLASSSEPNILYVLFRDYYHHFENWIVANNSNEIAKFSLKCIWKQKVDLFMCDPLMKNLSHSSVWANLFVQKLGVYVDRSIVLSEFSLQCVENTNVNLLEVAIAYLYRRDITVTFEVVQSFLEMINHCSNVDPLRIKNESKYKVLNQFLYQFATKDSSYFKEEIDIKPFTAGSSWTDDVVNSNNSNEDESSEATSCSPTAHNSLRRNSYSKQINSFLPRGSLKTWEKNAPSANNNDKQAILPLSPKKSPRELELIRLPFSQIPKDLTKLVNNKLYSNVTFLFPNNNNPERKKNNKDDADDDHFESNFETLLNLDDNDKSQKKSYHKKQEKYLKIYGHKEIIQSKSRYFSNMFNSGLKESNRPTLPHENDAINENNNYTKELNGILVPDIRSDIFLLVLVHLYGGEVKLTPDNCIPILQVADQLCLDSLKMVAEIYVGNNIELSDELLEIAEIYCAPRLHSLCKIRDIFSIDDEDDDENVNDKLDEDESAFLWS